ncbi:MAG: Lrp/AsnC family transcriptional regulator [Acidobacteria bacterium]|jgi:Lrp/AsnC family leucine-responsive transcriptional regulator|nr:Lrp/AsnC family transcriptional regulator [Acidobacteriota bacterium]
MNLNKTIDDIDLELLRELSLNGRESLTKLAEKLGLSKQRLGYRLRNLQRRGALTGFFAVPNIFRLGFDHFRVFVRFQRLTEAREKELLDHLLTRSDVSWLTQLDGDFDLEFVVWAQGVPAFEAAYDDILGQFGPLFQEKYFSLATRIEFLPWRFLAPGGTVGAARGAAVPRGIVLESRGGRLDIGPLDRRLLAELSRNGRLSLAALAGRCRVSSALAAQRLRSLKNSGAVAGFGAKIDHALLGWTYRKVFLRLENPAGAPLDRLSSWLRQQPEVIFLVKTIGSYDLEVELMTRPGAEFLAFMRRLRTTFAVDIAAFRSVIVLRELKYGQYPA